MNHNKVLLIFLIICFGFGFVSCSKPTTDTTTNQEKLIADLQNQITTLQSQTQKSADDAKKLADLQNQLATLSSNVEGERQRILNNSRIVTGCDCNYKPSASSPAGDAILVVTQVAAIGDNDDTLKTNKDRYCHKKAVEKAGNANIFAYTANCTSGLCSNNENVATCQALLGSPDQAGHGLTGGGPSQL